MADLSTNESDDSDLLVMATALHGLSEEAMSNGGRSITACGRQILRQTLYSKTTGPEILDALFMET